MKKLHPTNTQLEWDILRIRPRRGYQTCLMRCGFSQPLDVLLPTTLLLLLCSKHVLLCLSKIHCMCEMRASVVCRHLIRNTVLCTFSNPRDVIICQQHENAIQISLKYNFPLFFVLWYTLTSRSHCFAPHSFK